jgi:hypothetical protein
MLYGRIARKGASEKSIKMGNKTEPIILYSLQSILCMI